MSAPSTTSLLTQWSWEPSVVLGLAALTAGYAYVAGPLRRRRDLGAPLTTGQKWTFGLATATLVVALLSPIDTISDNYLFSVHMVQHLLLASLWPPLLLLALPAWMVRPVLAHRLVGPIVRAVTQPVTALILFNVDIYLWHLPPLYDLTLQNEGVHIVEHLSFMVLGLANWWPVLAPLPEQRLSYPGQMLYLIADGMLMMALGILFTFSPVLFYSAYSSAPILWGISHGVDQQLGGLIMWYPGNLPYAVLIVVAFYRWFDSGQTDLPVEEDAPTSIPYNEGAPTAAPSGWSEGRTT